MQTTILWEQFNQDADIPRMLKTHGWQRHTRQRGERIDYTRPGKTTREGVSANWDKSRRLLYVFTDGTEFTPDKAYNAVQVFCILECGGKMGDAARKLKELGYYTPKELKKTGSIRLEI